MTVLVAPTLTLAVGSPATARSVTITDPVNSPGRGDISAATYADRQLALSARVDVRRLRLAGRLRLRVSAPGSAVRYVATVTAPTSSGISPSIGLERLAAGSRTPVACDLSGTWSAEADRVRLRVPHSCLAFGRFRYRHTVSAKLAVGAHRDAAVARTVGRGDTPGCATAGELRRVRTGERRGVVHTHLDTAGRFGDGGAGGFSRVYRACDGGEPFYVEYDGQTSRVVGKGRVR